MTLYNHIPDFEHNQRRFRVGSPGEWLAAMFITATITATAVIINDPTPGFTETPVEMSDANVTVLDSYATDVWAYSNTPRGGTEPVAGVPLPPREYPTHLRPDAPVRVWIGDTKPGAANRTIRVFDVHPGLPDPTNTTMKVQKLPTQPGRVPVITDTTLICVETTSSSGERVSVWVSPTRTSPQHGECEMSTRARTTAGAAASPKETLGVSLG